MQGLLYVPFRRGAQGLPSQIAYKPEPIFRGLPFVVRRSPPLPLVNSFQYNATREIVKLWCIYEGLKLRHPRAKSRNLGVALGHGFTVMKEKSAWHSPNPSESVYTMRPCGLIVG